MVDQQCREINGKARIEGYTRVSGEQAHHRDIYQNRKALYHKIASLLAHLVFNFAMLSLDWKALPLMLVYGMMPLTMILWFQMGNITLQMLVFLLVMSDCFHTEVCTTILQSGDVPMFGMYFIIKGRITNQIFNTQPC